MGSPCLEKKRRLLCGEIATTLTSYIIMVALLPPSVLVDRNCRLEKLLYVESQVLYVELLCLLDAGTYRLSRANATAQY